MRYLEDSHVSGMNPLFSELLNGIFAQIQIIQSPPSIINRSTNQIGNYMTLKALLSPNLFTHQTHAYRNQTIHTQSIHTQSIHTQSIMTYKQIMKQYKAIDTDIPK